MNLIDDPFLDDLLGHFLGESWVMYAATSSSVPPKAKNFASEYMLIAQGLLKITHLIWGDLDFVRL